MSCRSLFTLFPCSVLVGCAILAGMPWSAGVSQNAAGFQLVPWKDELFKVPAVLESRHEGDYLILDYHSSRDINGQDTIPEKKARPERVSTEIADVQKDTRVKTKFGEIRHFTVGKTEGASIIVIYFHGKGGNRGQGVDDWTFGGNFNRLKNLVVRSGGLYLSPDVTSFNGKSANQITGLLLHYLTASPGAPVILACGSAGGSICYQLARKEELVPYLGGIIFLGSFPYGVFTDSAAWKARVPLYIGHGSGDYVSYVEKMEEVYRRVRESSPGYPVKMGRFETGTHGTPIRMIDWRKTINWQLSAH
jgi:hypothetical protein